jgi:hypothetical protein
MEVMVLPQLFPFAGRAEIMGISVEQASYAQRTPVARSTKVRLLFLDK